MSVEVEVNATNVECISIDRWSDRYRIVFGNAHVELTSDQLCELLEELNLWKESNS